MTAEEAAPVGRGPGMDRYPCPWCEQSQAWPDLCTEGVESSPLCASEIERRCMAGDHRRCAVGACTVSTRWHDEVRAAGAAASRASGQAWAVVSTLPNDVLVAGTADDLERARRLWHTVLRNAGRVEDPDARGRVYVVRGSDGALL